MHIGYRFPGMQCGAKCRTRNCVKFPTVGSILESSRQKDAPAPSEAGANSANRGEETAMELMSDGVLSHATVAMQGEDLFPDSPFHVGRALADQFGDGRLRQADLFPDLCLRHAGVHQFGNQGLPVHNGISHGGSIDNLRISMDRYFVNRNIDSLENHNSHMENLGKRLRAARKERKLTQAALATRVGMSQSLLSELETGGVPSTTFVAALAHALGVHARWLDCGLGAKYATETAASPEPAAAIDVSDLEADLLRDWRELLPEKRDAYAKAIQRDADEARAYKAMAGDRRGIVAPFSGADRRFNSGGLRSTETRRTMHTRVVYQGGGVRSGKLGERTIGQHEIEEMSGGEQ